MSPENFFFSSLSGVLQCKKGSETLEKEKEKNRWGVAGGKENMGCSERVGLGAVIWWTAYYKENSRKRG